MVYPIKDVCYNTKHIYHFLSESNEVDQDHTFFSANFFRMTNARDYRISYQDVRLRNTTDLSTAAQNITGQNITEQRPTEQDPLLMRDRFGDINGNNNWLRCKFYNHIMEHGWLWELANYSQRGSC